MKRFFNELSEWLETLTIRFERLSEREKRMSFLLGGALFVLIVGGTWFLLGQKIETKRVAITKTEKRLEEIRSLEARFKEAKKTTVDQEQRFKKNQITLFSLIQSEADRFSLKLYDLNERKEPVGKTNITQTSVVVNLKKVSVDRLTAFLQALEDAESNMVKVIRLKIKSRYDKSELLDAQMTVATWKAV